WVDFPEPSRPSTAINRPGKLSSANVFIDNTGRLDRAQRNTTVFSGGEEGAGARYIRVDLRGDKERGTETRRPKPEARKMAESRNPKSEWGGRRCAVVWQHGASWSSSWSVRVFTSKDTCLTQHCRLPTVARSLRGRNSGLSLAHWTFSATNGKVCL